MTVKETAECGNLKGGKKRYLDVVNIGESGILFAVFLIFYKRKRTKRWELGIAKKRGGTGLTCTSGGSSPHFLDGIYVWMYENN